MNQIFSITTTNWFECKYGFFLAHACGGLMKAFFHQLLFLMHEQFSMLQNVYLFIFVIFVMSFCSYRIGTIEGSSP